MSTPGADRPDHAKHSPSGAHRRFVCHGSLTLESFFPNTSSVYSDDGTAKHHVGAECLKYTKMDEPLQAAEFIGRGIQVNGKTEPFRQVEFTREMAEVTQTYVDYVRSIVGDDQYWVEQQVEFGDWIDVPEQFGTADVILLREVWDLDEQQVVYELVVIDAKFGHKYVPVEENPQLLYYALGAYSRFDLSHAIKSVRLVIFQPEQGGEREWTCSLEYLLQWAQTARSHETSVRLAAQEYAAIAEAPVEQRDRRLTVWMQTFLHPDPNEMDCAFCRATATCPAVQSKLEREVGASFSVIAETQEVPHHPTSGHEVGDENGDPVWVPYYSDETLGQAMRAAGLIEDWATAVRAEVERRLLEAKNDPAVCAQFGFGLELGRQGPRKWTETAKAEEAFKKFRLTTEQMYDLSLISPTRAEELATQKRNRKKEPIGPAPIIGPTQWKRLQELIKRAPPKPSVKPLAQIKTLYVPEELADGAFGAIPEDETLG
jgi:hypothetical protein